MSVFSIVAKKFSRTGFAEYVAHTPLESWKPKRIVLHNTASPSLAQRPSGLTAEHIENLHFYYQFKAPTKHGKTGWSGGPHLFVDQTGVWVFNPLDRKGTHSPSFNANAWGVEMLGDFDVEPFDSGDGLKVRSNAVSALSVLFRRLGIATVTNVNFKFHKEDTATDHDCPGKNVHKAQVMGLVQAQLDNPTGGVSSDRAIKLVVYRKGMGQSPVAVVDGYLREGASFAKGAQLAGATGLPAPADDPSGDVAVRAFVGTRYDLHWHPETDRVYLVEL